jgi:phage gpG-like protein
MSDLKITVDTAGLNDAFFRAGNVGVDIPAALKSIGGALRSATIDRFETETAPGGVKWKPLARSTVRRKEKLKKSPRILVMNSDLRNSINAQVQGWILEVGSPVRYAGVHQFGAVLQRAARTQTIYQSEAGVRSGDFKRMKFVKAKDATFARDVKVGAHKITIPARPFLDVGLVEDMPRVVEELDKRIRHALALPDSGDGRGA